MSKCKVTVMANQKGGTGKTTTTQVLGMGLAQRGKKVLLVDLDPQGNLTDFSSVTEDAKNNIYNVFQLKKSESQSKKNMEKEIDFMIKKSIVTTDYGYDIIAGSEELAGADMEFLMDKREYILKDAISTIRDDYDYILIDTPPALGILSVNALVAADDVVIVMAPAKASLRGFKQLYQTIQGISRLHNVNLKIKGVLVNMFRNTKVQLEYTDALKEITEHLGLKLFEYIRLASAVEESQHKEKNILMLNAKYQRVVNDYNSFIKEYLG